MHVEIFDLLFFCRSIFLAVTVEETVLLRAAHVDDVLVTLVARWYVRSEQGS